ncbi:MAG TPA: hypothetical protein VJ836_05605 [Candidatus Saccharimonadales bacterium]|nr:hypothetical protein [Candidatus Saccharimonadales bacterium]
MSGFTGEFAVVPGEDNPEGVLRSPNTRDWVVVVAGLEMLRGFLLGRQVLQGSMNEGVVRINNLLQGIGDPHNFQARLDAENRQ